jgi:hypothetical protein
MRSTALAMWLSESMGLPTETRSTTYWVAQLRYIGCTGHAHEVAVLFGDEIETRARTLVSDAADPFAVMRDVLGHARPQHRGVARIGTVLSLLAGGRRFAEMNFRTGCEVADLIVTRLGMDDAVRAALRHTFERWNGKGQPNGVRGAAIPLPMRIVHLTHDMEALARLRSPTDAIGLARDRAGTTYDPSLVDAFVDIAPDLFDQLDKVDPWNQVVAAEPRPHRLVEGHALDDACRHAGLDKNDAVAARRAGLLHDLGRTGIPNSIWDKLSALTRAEVDRVQLHRLLTEQMLRRSPTLAALNPLAACHHERADGTGYVRGLTTAQMRRPTGHLSQDRRQSYPTHLHQDRRLHPRSGGPLRRAARADPVIHHAAGPTIRPPGGPVRRTRRPIARCPPHPGSTRSSRRRSATSAA